MRRRAIRTPGEQDVHTRWRRWYCWTQRAGATRRVKTATNRRERREGRREARELDQ